MNGGTSTKGFAIRVVLFLTAVCLLGGPARAQTVNGGFHGTVSDSTGAVLPGATVEAKNNGTNLTRQSTADSTGFYTIVSLPPGVYTLTASNTGFSTAVQNNVQLLVNQDVELNFTLKVGVVSQQVQVTSEAPQLQTANSTISQVIGSRQVVELPLNGRQFTQLVLLAPGAAPKETGQQSSFTIPIGGGGLSPSVNGNRGQQNNFTLDGVLNNNIYTNVWAISPPPDAIQEFNVQSQMTDAQFSISSGANVNVVTKSGTNQFHGAVWEFLRNDKLDAANFFDNYFSHTKPAFRQNQFGFEAGGPLFIPHLYDGRAKKTYVSGYYEGFRSTQGFTEQNNVPSAAELSGDFSDLLTPNAQHPTAGQQAIVNGVPAVDNLGRPILNGQIYNPYSTRELTAGQVDPVTGLTATATGLVRDPFPGNMINLPLNQEALTYLKAFYPLPNLNVPPNTFPNFAASSPQIITSNQFGVRVDHTFANNDNLYGNFYYSQPIETQPTSLLLGAGVLTNKARVVAVGYTHLFSPTLLASFHYGYNYTNYGDTNQPGGEALLNATGQAALEPVRDGIPIVPQINLSPRLGGTGQFAIPLGPIRSQQFSADVQKIKGPHTFSAGFMLFHIHSFDDGWGQTTGFNQFPTSATYGTNLNASSTGDGLASMLLNLPANLFGFVGATYADDKTNWTGYYLQDKWQASRKLNIQIGIRYDYVPPAHYKNNQVSGWNPDCPVPAARYPSYSAGAITLENACLLIPVPFPTPPTSTLPNGTVVTNPSWPFPTVRQTYFDPKFNGWQPRFGFAYSADQKTVVRGAFTIFTDHNNTLVQESQDPRIAWPFGAGISFGSLNSGIVNCQAPSLALSQTCWSNPPAAAQFLPPVSYSPAFAFAATPRLKIPYNMEYNLSVERQFTPNLTATVSYVGSESRHLFIQPMYNAPLPSLMGPGPVPPRTPFPFFGQFPTDTNSGVSSYNSLQVKVQKRFSQGLTFLGSYTYSHCLSIQDEGQSGSIQNPYDWSADKASCDFNIPNIFVFSYAYQIPYGKGMHWGSTASGVENAILGGWQISGITTYESGLPFSATANATDVANINPSSETERANVTGQPLQPAGFKQTVQAWYNPAAFATPAPYTFGDVGRNTLRGDKSITWDFALLKNFRLTEATQLQFRSEFFNIFNNVNFAPPGGGSSGGFATLGGAQGTAVNGSTFMRITSAAASREIQFSLKILW
jgi:Carboxypeptidase regulatory-like domain/TonB dependent receptor